MKNQYFGDIGDYGKYGLLRFLAKSGIKIAVNWYLTENDKTGDGKFTDYLKNENKARYSKYDPDLYSILQSILCAEVKVRDVEQFELKDAIPNAVYFHKKLRMSKLRTSLERKSHREEWHRNALNACEDVDLVFLDPDNGLVDEPVSLRTAEKYVYAREVENYYERGQDVVYYCHKGRRKPEKWEDYKILMKSRLTDAALMGVTFHRGTQRSYIFICHPERVEKYRCLLEAFLTTEWGRIDKKSAPFTEERTEGFINIYAVDN